MIGRLLAGPAVLLALSLAAGRAPAQQVQPKSGPEVSASTPAATPSNGPASAEPARKTKKDKAAGHASHRDPVTSTLAGVPGLVGSTVGGGLSQAGSTIGGAFGAGKH
jgi:hypothetical protein